ncbi:hypothetical protein [Xanthomonas arboricola]|uniref:hypothetical protein n=1 Tax=Xanthomonas arboricola TaxID=56448 RepID=UPI00142FA7DC|nr:hypothetical protein [Xanthomonas arboricola]NJC02121.1 hypothetical protein [Xanthomonas arboricola]CAD7380086.1 hypothetical protein X12_001770 [Xanthomonas arboricola]
MIDLSEVSYIKRIVVGSDNPARMQTAEQVEAAQHLLNRCLSEAPRGTILGIEKSFTIVQLGEHQVVLQWLCYHVGFKRKPIWLTES